MNQIKRKQRFWYKWAHNIGHNGLRETVVIDVVKLGNGEIIVRHKEPNLWGFISYSIEDTPLQEFIDNTQSL